MMAWTGGEGEGGDSKPRDLTPDELDQRWLHWAITNHRRRQRRHFWLLVVVGLPLLVVGIVALEMIIKVL